MIVRQHADQIEDKLSTLVDDSAFQKLDGYFKRFNLFEAVGAVRAELRHSNFLAFLLSPNRSHNLGSSVLEKILKAVLAQIPPERRPLRLLELVVGDLDSAVVERERDNIDILIEIKPLSLVAIIENKVGSAVGEGQLQKYRTIIRQKYKGWRHVFILLTPDGIEPDDEEYIPFSYAELADVLAAHLSEVASSTNSEMNIILSHYVEILRRHIVEDTALIDLARQLYERHKDAFDFVFESRPQKENLLDPIRALLESNSTFIKDRLAPTMYFSPAAWAGIPALNSGPRDKWTKTGRNLQFEVKSFPHSDRINLALILGPSDNVFRKFVYENANKASAIFTGLVKPMGQIWSTIYSRELLSARAAVDMDTETKAQTIISNWNHFIQNDLSNLTNAISEIVGRFNSPHSEDGKAP